jgi:hypothetical protein
MCYLIYLYSYFSVWPLHGYYDTVIQQQFSKMVAIVDKNITFRN